MEHKQNSNRNIANGIIWKFAERLFSQGVSFVVSLILARLLAPEDFGVVAIVLVFIELANVFVISGLNTALVQKKDINETEISTTFYCSVILSVLIYIVMFFLAPIIAALYNNTLITEVLRVFALRIPISAIQQVPSAMLLKSLDFKTFFFSTMIGVVLSAVIGIGMALRGFGVWALVIQNLVAAVSDAVILSIVVKWVPKRCFSLKQTAPLLSFGWKILIAEFIGAVYINFNPMIIGLKYSSADLAYYTKGKNLPMLFRNNIYTTLLTVLYPAMANVNDDIKAVKNIAQTSIKTLSYITFPLMIGMTAISKDLVVALYTEKWIAMTPFIGIVCLDCMINIYPTITISTLKSLGHSGMILKLEFIKKPILFLGTLISIHYGIIAVALMLPLGTFFDAVITVSFGAKYTGYNLIHQFKDSLVPLALSLAMWLGILLIQMIEMPLILGLAVQVLGGALIYISLSAIFRIEQFKMLLEMAKSKLHFS